MVNGVEKNCGREETRRDCAQFFSRHFPLSERLEQAREGRVKQVFDSGISNYSCKVEVVKHKRKTIRRSLS